MTDRYERIRAALAMGPTPGPWEVINGTDVFTPLGARNAAGVEAAVDAGWHVADCDMGSSFTEEGKEEKISYEEKRANAGFIAACDPDTIRALLDERDALAAEVERLAEALRELEEREQRDEALLRQALEALIWTTGSEDFSDGGLAREGALKLLFPTIAALRERLGEKA
jgi:hypothetical protein